MIISFFTGTWLDKGSSTTNGNLEEQAQCRPPTPSQSRFLCHTLPHFLHLLPCVHPVSPLPPTLFDFQLSPWTTILLNLLWILMDLMDVVQFLEFPYTPIKGGMGKCIKIMGQLSNPPQTNGVGRRVKVRGLS